MTTPYQEHLNRHSDIREHLGLLHGLAMQCTKVVELGFRTGVSTSAFLAAGVKVRSYDIEHYPCRPFVQKLAKEYPDTFVFKVQDSREADLVENQLLFVDSAHTYDCTKAEVEHWHHACQRWMVFHDVESFGRKDRLPGKGPGIMPAIEEFLVRGEWRKLLHLPNNNGLLILERMIG